jgi:hypothetical protein
MGWNRFFHTRAPQPRASLVAGWARVAFAFLILADRLLLTVDFQRFFIDAMMPYEASSKNEQLEKSFSLFAVLPSTPASYYLMHLQGLVQALFLLLGVAPRIQLIGVYINMLTFHHHNALIWDGEDDMFRMYAFLLFWLPIHHITIYDKFGFGKSKKKQDDTSADYWPMWPFRLWQIEMSLIYSGAGLGKLASKSWQLGDALWDVRLLFCDGYYRI